MGVWKIFFRIRNIQLSMFLRPLPPARICLSLLPRIIVAVITYRETLSRLWLFPYACRTRTDFQCHKAIVLPINYQRIRSSTALLDILHLCHTAIRWYQAFSLTPCTPSVPHLVYQRLLSVDTVICYCFNIYLILS